MAQLDISVPDGLKDWAEKRVAEGRYSSTSDLVRDIMRRVQDEEAELAALQMAIDKGRASGIDPRPADKVLRDIMAKNRAKYG